MSAKSLLRESLGTAIIRTINGFIFTLGLVSFQVFSKARVFAKIALCKVRKKNVACKAHCFFIYNSALDDRIGTFFLMKALFSKWYFFSTTIGIFILQKLETWRKRTTTHSPDILLLLSPYGQ